MDLAMHYCGGCGSFVHCYFVREKYLCRYCLEGKKDEERIKAAIREVFDEELMEFLKG